ncbi:MAG: NifU family protein [Candidatus Riflebacteria bacterium]|nr:NifU family protein [Candidatus Riflebacteria bacterium]
MADTTQPSPETPIFIDLEWTPNPNTIKLVVNRPLMPKGIANFKTVAEAEASVLAQKLFAVAGVDGVMFGPNFVTLTRGETGDWLEIHEKSVAALKAHLDEGRPVLDKPLPEKPAGEATSADAAAIQQILDNEIRPAIVMDGGDIVFESYDDGVLYVRMRGACHGCPSAVFTLKMMRGACHGCPSAVFTLKMGIEQRLRQTIPGLKEVVQI